PPPNQSYLAFNGCTNFNAKITLAIPSTSCSSNATGLAAGMAGLIYSAAYTAHQKGALQPSPNRSLCRLVASSHLSGDDRCLITPNEVRQLMASGTIGGLLQADDVNFADGLTPDLASCSPLPLPGCTDPNGLLQTQVTANRTSLAPLAPAIMQSYPARAGHDQFYGYGRVNMARAVSALLSDPAAPGRPRIPPSVEIDSPQWFQQVSPGQTSLAVRGEVHARGELFTCDIYVAPGHYPNNRLTTQVPPGDFQKISNGACNGLVPRRAALDGTLGSINLGALKSRFPASTRATGFAGNEAGGPGQAQTSNGRPNTDPYGFVVKVVASTGAGSARMTGEDQRAAFLHRDQEMLPGFPKAIGRGVVTQGTPTSDGESSPALADLDGDNRSELVLAGSDGFVHALRPDGSELSGWPVRGDRPPLHLGGRAFASGEVTREVGNAIVASVAVDDVDRDGIPEVFAADLEGGVYGWRADGRHFFAAHTNPDFSGAPLPGRPFESPRYQPGQSGLHRTQPGFLGSPALADLDGDRRLEVIAAAMDRHVYAWRADGSAVPGFPVLVVDPAKVESVDPQTHQVTFRADSGSLQQGAIIDTPAVADLIGDEGPEIVVGTNEEYEAGADGGFNAAPPNGSSGTLLDTARTTVEGLKGICGSPCDAIPDVPISPANTRLYALHGDGAVHGDGPPGYENAILPGWPAKLGILNSELLPVVGEGVSGSPVVAKASCGGAGSGGGGAKVGALANNGEAYVFDVLGRSCFGRDADGHDVPVQTDVGASTNIDRPLVPAVGHPVFAKLGDDMSLLSPAAGLMRALDVALPEYQRLGQDFLGAWSLANGGQLRPNFPQPMNDLQFLTGPSVGQLDDTPGQDVVAGSASHDLRAYTALGAPLSSAWPKLTGDWTIANPTLGSFGTIDTAPGARKVVIALTRSGYLFAYRTTAPACSPSEWPRFHHDNANSGDYGRDAALPGKPTLLSAGATELGFTSPGDDLMCGAPARYEIHTSRRPITEAGFGAATPLENPPAAGAPGSRRTYTLPPSVRRYVAVRAVDEQGNAGRVASIRLP
ncbi:MAG: FG-GAP repeat domain-containing protein, partial [Solirubrobacterales bacterium]